MRIKMSDVPEMVKMLDANVVRINKITNALDGGCCFIAAMIAAFLEDLGVPYKVACYIHAGADTDNIWSAAKDENLAHVSIIVDGTELGGDINHLMSSEHVQKKIVRLSSDELWSLYDDNTWNEAFKPDEEEVENMLNDFFDEVPKMF